MKKFKSNFLLNSTVWIVELHMSCWSTLCSTTRAVTYCSTNLGFSIFDSWTCTTTCGAGNQTTNSMTDRWLLCLLSHSKGSKWEKLKSEKQLKERDRGTAIMQTSLLHVSSTMGLHLWWNTEQSPKYPLRSGLAQEIISPNILSEKIFLGGHLIKIE